jgi:hypothetical protein
MNATELAAWVGASTGLLSLGWNIYLKLSSGPKLAVTAFAGMVMMPPPPHNPRILKITVQNVGTSPTTITNLTFHTYDSWWRRFRRRPSVSAVLNHYRGPDMPHMIEVGGEWVAVMEQEGEFNEWLGSGNLWCEVHHSFSKKPTRSKIRNLSDRADDSPKEK